MFGYIVTDRDQLTKEEQLRYRSYYCGLCRALKDKYGAAGQLTLNFDMTFLNILLSSFYEPTEHIESGRCIVHPFVKREKRRSEISDYCADMTVLLAYYNALDDWHDDRSKSKLRFANRLRPFATALREQYPRQCKAITENIEKINVLERQREINLDAVANCFGELMGEIFVCKEDLWSDRFRALGQELGRFIYFMDAWEDATRDLKHKNYNPLLQIKGEADYERKCKDILTMFLGAAAEQFEAMPIVENIHLLRNILYAGVWSKFRIKGEKNVRKQL
ncbi:MAG: hypothetical protein IKY33_04630 [Clostridia bacterium]|nr:hypothetical protein [Clostridia bacterium]